MNNIIENLNYIISDGDSDTVKFQKIFKKMNENCIKIYMGSIEITNFDENYTLGAILFQLQDTCTDTCIRMPFICRTDRYNSEIHNIITDFKRIIIFEKLGLLPTKTMITNENSNVGNATEKQKSLLKDKMTIPECKEIIEIKLKEYGLLSLEEIDKNQASKIIDNLPKKRNYN
ncbi:MAG: hypothetical protein ACRCU6_00080 [Fusobacteriaceae bacterium]